jgi:hypothetical protein
MGTHLHGRSPDAVGVSPVVSAKRTPGSTVSSLRDYCRFRARDSSFFGVM